MENPYDGAEAVNLASMTAADVEAAHALLQLRSEADEALLLLQSAPVPSDSARDVAMEDTSSSSSMSSTETEIMDKATMIAEYRQWKKASDAAKVAKAQPAGAFRTPKAHSKPEVLPSATVQPPPAVTSRLAAMPYDPFVSQSGAWHHMRSHSERELHVHNPQLYTAAELQSIERDFIRRENEDNRAKAELEVTLAPDQAKTERERIEKATDTVNKLRQMRHQQPPRVDASSQRQDTVGYSSDIPRASQRHDGQQWLYSPYMGRDLPVSPLRLQPPMPIIQPHHNRLTLDGTSNNNAVNIQVPIREQLPNPYTVDPSRLPPMSNWATPYKRSAVQMQRLRATAQAQHSQIIDLSAARVIQTMHPVPDVAPHPPAAPRYHQAKLISARDAQVLDMLGAKQFNIMQRRGVLPSQQGIQD